MRAGRRSRTMNDWARRHPCRKGGPAPDGCTAAVADPVRVRHLLPHPVSRIHDRPGPLAGLRRVALAADPRRAVARRLFLLAQDLRRVLRHGGGLGHRDELPVRHQLGGAERARRRDPRAAAELRGADRVLPRGDLPRGDAVRLAQGVRPAALLRHLHGRAGHAAVDVLDHLRQQLDADATGLPDRRARLLPAGRLVGDRVQSLVPVPAGAHGAGRVHHHLPGDRRGQRVVPAPRRAPGRGVAHAQVRHRVRRDRGAAAHPRRRPARPERGRAPAGEAGRDRGPLARGRTRRGHAAGAGRLSRRGGRAQRVRGGGAAPGGPDPQARLERHDPAAERGAGRRAPAGGARVLGVPGDGGARAADAGAGLAVAVGVAPRAARQYALAAGFLSPDERDRRPCTAGGLVRGRDRPPAVDDLRCAAHQRVGEPEHHRGGGVVVAGGVRRGLCGDLRRGHLVPAQADAGRAGAAAAQGHPRRREDAGAAAVGAGRAGGCAGAGPDDRRGGRVMGLETVLPVLWFAVIGFGVLMYVLLDGFVLGLGILAPFAEDGDQLDHMMNTAAPIWDGNETWLVLGGAGLLAAFPAAYALVLSTLYLPVLMMLIALIFRGVAFEFRFKATSGRRFWGAAFSVGSVVAAFAQGVILGALVEGLPHPTLAGLPSMFSWFSPFSMLTGIALVFGYALLGATWLVLKTTGALQKVARTLTRPLVLVVVAFMGLVSAWLPFLDRS